MFFKFSSRRLIELHELHCKLALIRPDNYGTLSAFILHLMRAVMVTPSNVPSYVRYTLQILHQRRVMEMFGMFFIDDLDLDDMEGIDVNLGKDGSEIKQHHKAALATRFRPKKDQSRGIQLMELHRTAEYPWGETISWGTLQRLCKEHAVDFLRPFDFDQVDTAGLNPFHLVESLFVAFTRDAWLGLQEGFLPAGVRPKPEDLKGSMEVWSCQNILARLGGKCNFFPSSYHLEGAPRSEASNLSFKALRSVFFPTPDKRLKPNSIWAGYSEQNGYIGRYWEILETYKDDANILQMLHEGMDKVFEQVQCLPKGNTPSNLWHGMGGSVCFLTNPHYYRIAAVSATARKLEPGPQRPQVSKAELQRRLDPGNSTSKKRKRSLKKNQSTKKKNYRQPPKKQQRMIQPISTQKRTQQAESEKGKDSSSDATDSDGRTTNTSGSTESSSDSYTE
jgi:hypothetical protein